VKDVPRLAIPAIVDVANSKSHVVVGANHKTWNQIVDAAEQIRGIKIHREYVDLPKIQAHGASAQDFIVKMGAIVLALYQGDTPRADFSQNAYNLKYPGKYQGFTFVSVEDFIKAGISKQ
jgi:23S rRNA U2552 (ribose-2'-O)-methylase RlmE/FtsJ